MSLPVGEQIPRPNGSRWSSAPRPDSLKRVGDDREVLEAIADAIQSALGFQTLAINLYRPATDDYAPVLIRGSAEVHEVLEGTVLTRESWMRLLDRRFERGGCFFVPEGEAEWPEHTYLGPERGDPEDGRRWRAGDGLLIPLKASDGKILGLISVDEPSSGCRPTDGEFGHLATLARRGARELEAARTATEGRSG